MLVPAGEVLLAVVGPVAWFVAVVTAADVLAAAVELEAVVVVGVGLACHMVAVLAVLWRLATGGCLEMAAVKMVPVKGGFLAALGIPRALAAAVVAACFFAAAVKWSVMGCLLPAGERPREDVAASLVHRGFQRSELATEPAVCAVVAAVEMLAAVAVSAAVASVRPELVEKNAVLAWIAAKTAVGPVAGRMPVAEVPAAVVLEKLVGARGETVVVMGADAALHCLFAVKAVAANAGKSG